MCVSCAEAPQWAATYSPRPPPLPLRWLAGSMASWSHGDAGRPDPSAGATERVTGAVGVQPGLCQLGLF